MKVELSLLIELIEKKNSWGKNDLKDALLNLLANTRESEPERDK